MKNVCDDFEHYVWDPAEKVFKRDSLLDFSPENLIKEEPIKRSKC